MNLVYFVEQLHDLLILSGKTVELLEFNHYYKLHNIVRSASRVKKKIERQINLGGNDGRSATRKN